MSMNQAPWQPGDDSADADVEWAFSGAHDIEWWVVREGRLVPAESSDLERIAERERERERAALPRFRVWERKQHHRQAAGVITRLVSWCRTVTLHLRQGRPAAVQLVVESNEEVVPPSQQNAARR